eukprot:CAMPEP_0113276218 /NCGR_PEP_ID=MMETSP0008_2-20120614/25373_1 /TAXON_ID=97485 /ORGANISM="Prymnesium parvum" /LENGTH=136 /DNA_ID=CAMNT_0000125999 /DNA_START=609 /DNA_END=1019 /DNA_ORIENTATION=- /assembly_acc=CAM_ASM_000153
MGVEIRHPNVACFPTSLGGLERPPDARRLIRCVAPMMKEQEVCVSGVQLTKDVVDVPHGERRVHGLDLGRVVPTASARDACGDEDLLSPKRVHLWGDVRAIAVTIEVLDGGARSRSLEPLDEIVPAHHHHRYCASA